VPGTLHAAVVSGERQNETETGAGQEGRKMLGKVGGKWADCLASQACGHWTAPWSPAKQIDNLAGTLAAGDPIRHASSPHRGPVYGQSELRALLLQLDGCN